MTHSGSLEKYFTLNLVGDQENAMIQAKTEGFN